MQRPTATADNPIETFMGRPFQRSPLVAADDHHWDIMAEFLGLYEPGLVRRNIAIAGPQGPAARFRARIATRRAWADLIYTVIGGFYRWQLRTSAYWLLMVVRCF